MDLTLKKLPPAVHQKLKARAAAHRRSLSQEAIACLESVVLAERRDPDAVLVEARRLRRRVRVRATDADLRALKDAGRP